MDSSWLLLSAAIMMATVLLLAVCVNCRKDGPLVSIQQTHASEDYVPSTDFRVVPLARHTDPTSMHSQDSGLLRPPGSERRESDSNCSYENQGAECPDSDPDDLDDPDDPDGSGYILVLPDGKAPPTLSRTSTPSSDGQHNYVNVKDDQDYVNVKSDSFSEATAESSDEEGNYVNQPTMIHPEPSA